MDKEQKNSATEVQQNNTHNYIYAAIVGTLVLVGILTILFAESSTGISDPIIIPTEEPIACTKDARICPDGSAVGRVPPNCEFEACPETLDDITYLFKGEDFAGDIPVGYVQFATDDSTLQNMLLEVFGPMNAPSCMGTIDGSACVTSEDFKDLNIDWEKSYVAAYAMEKQGSGGYDVEVIDITTDDDGYVVNIKEIWPGDSCFTTSAITQPYIIVKINYPEGENKLGGFSFDTSYEMISCDRDYEAAP